MLQKNPTTILSILLFSCATSMMASEVNLKSQTNFTEAGLTEEQFQERVKTNAALRQLTVALSEDNIDVVQELLPFAARSNFISTNLYTEPTMLSQTIRACDNRSSNFENKIKIILLLLQAGASPFAGRPIFTEILKLSATMFPELNDQRIYDGIAEYLARKFKPLQAEEEFKTETTRCLTELLNYGDKFNPTDIVNEYLFPIEGDSKFVRWHDEDEKKE